MKNKKILQVYNYDSVAKTFLLPLVDRLEEEGYDVWTICSLTELKGKGYKIKDIKIERKIVSIANVLAIFKIAKFIKEENFDIIHVHTPIAALIARISAKLARVPIIIYTAHGFYFHDNMLNIKYKFHVTLEKIMGRFFTDYIFTQSEEDKETAIQENIINKNRITAIGNGVDPNKFNPNTIEEDKSKLRKEFNIKKNDDVICFIGRLVEEKGIIELIKSFKKLNEEVENCKLLVVGDSITDRDSETKNLIRDLVDKYNLEKNVIFAGYRNDIPEILYLSDLFVLPSHREGMPRSIIEAMMMAKPVVATNIRGCREEVKDGKTGYLVDVNSPEQLFNAIYNIFSNKDIKDKMGELGHKRALKLYDENKVLERQINIINQLCELYL